MYRMHLSIVCSEVVFEKYLGNGKYLFLAFWIGKRRMIQLTDMICGSSYIKTAKCFYADTWACVRDGMDVREWFPCS